ncbi:hypothetical protein [Salipiger mucosus]|uniref:Uncharacterized protein n=1 Tax=Salipiger mucosus DSM 16094 TaxID=1123237 RepID=S9R599_9RHOB|nr:hypothetical protein [Salipiger mucosus]EPX87082.1 hypothetical protein Salmuc_00035 [Salipiger mucosus DSM 16094]
MFLGMSAGLLAASLAGLMAPRLSIGRVLDPLAGLVGGGLGSALAVTSAGDGPALWAAAAAGGLLALLLAGLIAHSTAE